MMPTNALERHDNNEAIRGILRDGHSLIVFAWLIVFALQQVCSDNLPQIGIFKFFCILFPWITLGDIRLARSLRPIPSA